MSLNTILSRWKTDPGIAPNISAWQVIPKRIPSFEDIPISIDQNLRDFLVSKRILSLYSHQLRTWDSVQAGNNVVLSTGTASGKSLAYQLPILDSTLKNTQTRSLLLFPTKALAHDQLDWLNSFSEISAFAYDGDTPSHQRSSIRQQANIIVSNPDMLHLGILPYHVHWADFFSNLQFVVIDEMHTYRGVFGSHVANILRRLKRITSHYGAKPIFILTSATIGNPQELASALIEEDLILINDDSSARGEKHFLVYNPPIIDSKLGIRASMQQESIRLSSELISSGNQTILFGRSRRSVEFMHKALKEREASFENSIQSYRSGYLASQRRQIESDLRSGIIRGVITTNAFELGIDIGGLDAAVLAGYPGTIAGTWQQAGRSGRSDQPSVSVLVASSYPLDQYLALHPEYLFSTNPECGYIDANNLLIVLAHIQCAAYELPFRVNSKYGSFSVPQTQDFLDVLANSGKVHVSQDIYFWMSEDYPAASISLRTASTRKITLQYKTNVSNFSTLGLIDLDSAYWMVHPGAVYLHQGEIYLVKELNLDQKTAFLQPAQIDYYTEAERKTNFSILQAPQEEQIPGATKFFGDLNVTSQVTGYKKIKWRPYEILAREKLDLPPTTLQTTGFWITLSQQTEDALRNEGLWTSSPNDYGPDWTSTRLTVLKRDQHVCQMCGKKRSGQDLHVHHKNPLRSFTNFREANTLSNLISLCPRCHQRAESIVRINSGIRGLGHVIHSLAPLLLMCDQADLGVHADFKSPFGDNRPIVILYELIPAGIGFSYSLFNRERELLESALRLVQDCPCKNGCPSCVGPGGESGTGGKTETLAILNYLCS